MHDEDEEPAPKPRKKVGGKSGEASPAESGPSWIEKGKGRAEPVRPPAEKPKVVLSMIEVQMQMLGVLHEILGEVRQTCAVLEKASELTANNMTAMDGNLKLYTDHIAERMRTERRKLAWKQDELLTMGKELSVREQLGKLDLAAGNVAGVATAQDMEMAETSDETTPEKPKPVPEVVMAELEESKSNTKSSKEHEIKKPEPEKKVAEVVVNNLGKIE